MKRISRILYVLVIIGVIFAVPSSTSRADEAEDGSKEKPWIVESWDDLTKKVAETQGYFRLNKDVINEEGELTIPVGSEVTLDLNGYSLTCGGIFVGEYDESGEQSISLNIISTAEGGKLETASISVVGNLSFSNCKSTITGGIIGNDGELTLSGASVTCGGTGSDMSFGWFGTKVSLSGESTLDIGNISLGVSGNTGIALGYGCKIANVSSISVEADKPEEYISMVEKYATAAGYGLTYDSESNVLVFTDENEEVVTVGELLSDEVKEAEKFTITFVDYDGKVLQSSKIASGKTPVYGGDTPEKASDSTYNAFVFAGWDPEITAITRDVTYKAVYKKIAFTIDGHGSDYSKTYDGKQPEIQVMIDDRVMEASEYTVYIKENESGKKQLSDTGINAGEYQVVVKDIDGYECELTGAYNINRATPSYDAPTDPIDGTLSIDDKNKLLGFPKDINGNDLSGTWAWYEIKNKGEGIKEYQVEFNPDDLNYSGITTTVTISSWGTPTTIEAERSPITNFKASDGTTSAEVKKNDIAWLREESDGTSAWYGIDNSRGAFASGSRFWVRWISAESDSKEFEKYYNQLDDEHKKKAEGGNMWIFLVGVTDPDGNEYTGLPQDVGLYVQLGDEWDIDDINALLISEGDDEKLYLDILSGYTSPEGGNGRFAMLNLKHFSPYVIYAASKSENNQQTDVDIEPSTNKEKETQKIVDSSPQTGDDSGLGLLIVAAVASLTALFLAVSGKRNNHRE